MPFSVPVNNSDGRFSENAERGSDNLHATLPQFFQCKKRLVLPGDQDVANSTLRKGCGRAACASFLHGNIAEQFREKLLRLGVVIAVLLERKAPGRQIIPARPARGLRIGRDYLDTGLYQVVPVFDALG